MRFIYQRGSGVKRRVVHLAGYDKWSGRPLLIPICGEDRVRFDTSCNLPLGLPVCKRCLRAVHSAK